MAYSDKLKPREWVGIGLLIAGIGTAMMFVCNLANAWDKKGKMLDAEWKLKYNDRTGEPRPEYWAHKLETEQELEAQALWRNRLQRARNANGEVKR